MLLANVVIPHHHHESEVCIVVSHCESDSEKHSDELSDHNHDHNKTNDTDHCALDQVYIVATDNIKQDYNQIIVLSNSYDYDLPDHNSAVIDTELLSSYHIGSTYLYGDRLFLYCDFVSTVKGLRAPPTV